MTQATNVLEMTTFNHLYQWLTNDLRPFISGISKKYHLTYEQYMLLQIVGEHERISGSDLAVHQGVSRAAISRRCRELQLSGLINGIARQEPDYRMTYFELTEYGQQVTAELNMAYTKWLENVMACYGTDKLTTLMQMVNELLKQAKTAKAVVNS